MRGIADPLRRSIEKRLIYANLIGEQLIQQLQIP